MVGSNIGNIYATLGMDKSQFDKALDSAQKQLSTFDVAMGSMLGNIAAGVISQATAAIGQAASALSNLASSATMASAQMEQTKIAFTTMLGGAQEADTFIKEMQDFAARTPFEFPQLLQSARMMKAFGIETKQVLPMLTAIGDAAAGLGLGAETISRITLAMGQMKMKTKVSGEEMRQLAEAGIPAWKYLADAAGKSVAEMQKLSEKGALDAETAIKSILEGMNKDFNGMMANQSKTLLGLWSTMKDNAGFALRDMGDVIAAPLKAAMEQVGKMFEEMSQSGQIKNAMQMLGAMAAEAFMAGIQVLSGVLESFISVAIMYQETKLATAVNDLADAADRLKGIKGEGSWLQNLTGSMEYITAEQLSAKKDSLVSRINALNTQLESLYGLQKNAATGFAAMTAAAQKALVPVKALSLEEAQFLLGEGAQFRPPKQGKGKEAQGPFISNFMGPEQIGTKEEIAAIADAYQIMFNEGKVGADAFARSMNLLTQAEAERRQALKTAKATGPGENPLAQEEFQYQKKLEEQNAYRQATADATMYWNEYDLAAQQAQDVKSAELAALAGQARYDQWAKEHELYLALQAQMSSEQMSYKQSAIQGILSATQTLSNGMATMITQMKLSWSSFASLFKQVAQAIIQDLIRIAIQAAITKAIMSFAGIGAPADLAGGGFYHGGMTEVAGVGDGGIGSISGRTPAETTFTLTGGERVISPRQNQDLTRFLNGAGSGGGSGPTQIFLDGNLIAESVTKNVARGSSFGRQSLALAGA